MKSLSPFIAEHAFIRSGPVSAGAGFSLSRVPASFRNFASGCARIARFAVPLCIAACLMLIASGCTDSTTAPGNEIKFPDSTVSYSAHVQPFFTLRCSYSGCHDDQTRAGDVSLTSYIALTTRPGIVIPGNSGNSLLMQKIDGRLPHSPGTPILINDNQLKGIKRWIDEGARNN